MNSLRRKRQVLVMVVVVVKEGNGGRERREGGEKRKEGWEEASDTYPQGRRMGRKGWQRWRTDHTLFDLSDAGSLPQ
ncbi:hypothetical protein Pmani_030760 [Petrolisthes manimaculis]|uniref:Uncharacterized protein n=1 Tax=Petrolisthes manimaculis TaxID=1843537 RepID=A0AAE1NVB3_9EUCA|nr:hypothetical protein Pmani_030760 [Petrolisthes manimaculis]